MNYQQFLESKIKLNPDYFAASVGYLKAIEREVLSPNLFDLISGEMEAAA